MRHLFAGVALVIAAAALSGCYYEPGYGYVRGSTYSGDAYYGTPAPVYNDGYYGGYYDDYGYSGCCYAPRVSVGIRSVWYGGSGYRGDGRAYYGHGYDRYDRRGSSPRGGRYDGRGDGHSSHAGNSRRGDHDRDRDRDRDGSRGH